MPIRRAALLLLLCLLPHLALAQGRPMECFTKAEQRAEQMVREGLRLREGAIGCDGPPWRAGTRPLWDDIDRRFGGQFAAQTRVRERAFRREFAKDAENRLQMWNGRIVMHFRHYPLSETYCAGIKDVLQKMQKGGWRAFTGLAAKAKDQVKMDYRPCGE